MATNKEDRSFKTLINKRTTSGDKRSFEEFGDRTINVHAVELWAEDLPDNDPAQGIALGIVEQKTLFALTEDTSVSLQQAWYANDGGRLKDWISDKYGVSYAVHLFDGSNNEIFPTDASDWIFDYQTGILTFSGSTSGHDKPYKITGYRYIGNKGSPEPARETVEALTFTVSTGGVDPTSPVTFGTQAEVTAWGAFRTIAAAIAAAPEYLKHTVTVQLPSGLWDLDAAQFGNIGRLQPTLTGWLCVKGHNSWSQVAGTPASMAVTSSDGGGNVTLAADPGLVADAFLGYYLLVLSGTGAGLYKPIETHTGAAFKVSDSYASGLDATSVVQIVERASTIRMNSLGLLISGTVGHVNYWDIEFWGMNMVPPSGESWWYLGTEKISLGLTNGTIIRDGGFFSGLSNIALHACIIDTRNYGGNAINLQGGMLRTVNSRYYLHLFIGSGGSSIGISLAAAGGNAGYGGGAAAYLLGIHAFINWGNAFIQGRYDGTNIRIGSSDDGVLASDQSADVAIQLVKGAKVFVGVSATYAASTFKGSVNDVSLDGVGVDWSDVDADANKSYIGPRLSAVMDDD